jgi:hypothetical protein
VVAAGVFAPGHLGELTRIVSFDLVDAALESARMAGTRVRSLPARVVVYLLLAGCLFEGVGYLGVWAKLTAGLDPIAVATPGSSALAQARRRLGAKPLRLLFGLVAGPPAGAVRWRDMLVCAIDGTSMFVPDSKANLSVYRRQSGGVNGDSGFPMLRLVAIVVCGTRTVLDAVFGSYGVSELAMTPRLFGCLGERMLLLADRNFAAADLVARLADTKADLLIRCKTNLKHPSIERLADGSWLTPLCGVVVRVIEIEIAVTPKGGGRRTERYRFITTLTDPRRFPAVELAALYHRRWEIETTYLEMKSTILDGRVLRARTPAGIEQEVWALLTVYQALRLSIADAVLTTPEATPLQCSFTTALETARNQLILAAGIIDTTGIDLVGRIGRAVLAELLPRRRPRQCPRVVKRAISKHRAKGQIDRTNYPHIDITIRQLNPPT